ncbi:MAG: hypothetical protein C0514_08800 [Candidatus Puniceispirillum sp.]|nr:hypothetical protein [Candidatus Puniceispirillum sp.]
MSKRRLFCVAIGVLLGTRSLYASDPLQQEPAQGVSLKGSVSRSADPALEYLKNNAQGFTPALAASLTGSDTFMRDPDQSVQDLLHMTLSLPELTLADAWHVYAYKSHWLPGEAEEFMAQWWDLSLHLPHTQNEVSALKELAPLMFMGPVINAVTNARAPQDPDLADNILSTLEDNEVLTLSQMRTLMTALHGKSGVCVLYSVALLEELGIARPAHFPYHLEYFSGLCQELHRSDILRTFALAMLPRELQAWDKCEQIECLLEHETLGPVLKDPQRGPAYLHHMQRLMPIYEPQRMFTFADLPIHEVGEAVDAALVWGVGGKKEDAAPEEGTMQAIKRLTSRRFEHTLALKKAWDTGAFKGDPNAALSLAHHAGPAFDKSETWDQVWLDAQSLSSVYGVSLSFEESVLLACMPRALRHSFMHDTALLTCDLGQGERQSVFEHFKGVINQDGLLRAHIAAYARRMGALAPFQGAFTKAPELVRALNALERVSENDLPLFIQTMLPFKEHKNLSAFMEKCALFPPASWGAITNRLRTDKAQRPIAFLDQLAKVWQELQKPLHGPSSSTPQVLQGGWKREKAFVRRLAALE